MKKEKINKIMFERGDYVEQFGSIYIYLGNTMWMSKNSGDIFTGPSTYTIREGYNLNLKLRYVMNGQEALVLFDGIPKQKDCYINA